MRRSGATRVQELQHKKFLRTSGYALATRKSGLNNLNTPRDAIKYKNFVTRWQDSRFLLMVTYLEGCDRCASRDDLIRDTYVPDPESKSFSPPNTVLTIPQSSKFTSLRTWYIRCVDPAIAAGHLSREVIFHSDPTSKLWVYYIVANSIVCLFSSSPFRRTDCQDMTSRTDWPAVTTWLEVGQLSRWGKITKG